MINSITNDELRFLKSFKGKTVNEVIEILEKKEQEINNKQSLLQEQKMNWYRSCIGKYYKIQNNNTSFTLVYIKDRKKNKNIDQYQYQNNPLYFLTWECYDIVISDQSTIKSNAGFNFLWLCNPYENGKMTSTCKEISKEEFEEITTPFNSLVNKAQQILTK